MATDPIIPFSYLATGPADSAKTGINFDQLLKYIRDRNNGTTAWDTFIMTGTTTNNNAATGIVGEYLESIISTAANAPTSTQYGDLTSLSLTAGDWDIIGFIQWNSNGATWTAGRTGISSTTGNSATGLTAGSNLAESIYASTSTVTLNYSHTVYLRVSIASTTTYYLKYRADYSAGTPQAQGSLKARRTR